MKRRCFFGTLAVAIGVPRLAGFKGDRPKFCAFQAVQPCRVRLQIKRSVVDVDLAGEQIIYLSAVRRFALLRGVGVAFLRPDRPSLTSGGAEILSA